MFIFNIDPVDSVAGLKRRYHSIFTNHDAGFFRTLLLSEILHTTKKQKPQRLLWFTVGLLF
jgi:hypothetical protein